MRLGEGVDEVKKEIGKNGRKLFKMKFLGRGEEIWGSRQRREELRNLFMHLSVCFVFYVMSCKLM